MLFLACWDINDVFRYLSGWKIPRDVIGVYSTTRVSGPELDGIAFVYRACCMGRVVVVEQLGWWLDNAVEIGSTVALLDGACGCWLGLWCVGCHLCRVSAIWAEG